MTPAKPQLQNENTGQCRWWMFTGCWGLVALIWLVLLPAHSDLPSVRAQQELWEEQGVDPAVMYYSELENLPLLLSDWDRRQKEHPYALWQIPGWNEPSPQTSPAQSGLTED